MLKISLYLIFCFGYLPTTAQTCTGIYIQDFYTPGTHAISGTIKTSSTALNSVLLQWSLNGGAIQEELISNFESYQDGSSKYYNVFTSNGGFLVDDYQENELEIWLLEPDGEEGEEIELDDNSFEFQRTLISTETSVLLEEVTATFCGWCPEAHHRADVLEEVYGEQVVGLTFHQNDGMNSDNVDDVVDEWDIPRPRGMFNRMHIDDDLFLDGENESIYHRYKFWDDLMRHAVTRQAGVALSVDTEYEEGSRLLEIEASATFIREMEGDFRFNCFVVEKEFNSFDAEYDQDNNYYNDPESPFYQDDDPIENYVHKRWVREILSGAWGEEDVIAEEITAMDAFTHEWSFVLPDDFNEDEMQIVVVIQEHNSNNEKRPILNSIAVDMGDNKTHSITHHQTETDFVVDLKVLLEGPYDANGIMHNNLGSQLPNSQPFDAAPYSYSGNETALKAALDFGVDWVLVELRTGSPKTTGSRNTVTVQRHAGIVQKDGSIVGGDGNPLIFNNLAKDVEYRFCIRHRNHLDVLTDDDFYGAELMEIDLRSNPVGAWGTEQLKESADGYYLMHGGDYNQDGVIQNTDYDEWIIEPAALSVYQNSDGDLNAVIQNTDFDLWTKNKAKVGSPEIQY